MSSSQTIISQAYFRSKVLLLARLPVVAVCDAIRVTIDVTRHVSRRVQLVFC
jgi:hypothetical protein